MIFSYVIICALVEVVPMKERQLNMEITDVRVRMVAKEGKMKAVVSVTFDNCFVVHDIKIIEGTDKLFIAMPSRKTPEGEYKDIAHPINMDMREMLSERILEKYNSTLIQDENL